MKRQTYTQVDPIPTTEQYMENGDTLIFANFHEHILPEGNSSGYDSDVAAKQISMRLRNIADKLDDGTISSLTGSLAYVDGNEMSVFTSNMTIDKQINYVGTDVFNVLNDEMASRAMVMFHENINVEQEIHGNLMFSFSSGSVDNKDEYLHIAVDENLIDS